MPPVRCWLRVSKTVRDAILFWDIDRDSERYLSVSEMSTWWCDNRKYISGNQRKVVCLILNFLIKTNRYFIDCFLNYFHGKRTWICCCHDFLVSVFAGNAIRLTNKLRKWTQMYGLKCGTKTFGACEQEIEIAQILARNLWHSNGYTYIFGGAQSNGRTPDTAWKWSTPKIKYVVQNPAITTNRK